MSSQEIRNRHERVPDAMHIFQRKLYKRGTEITQNVSKIRGWEMAHEKGRESSNNFKSKGHS